MLSRTWRGVVVLSLGVVALNAPTQAETLDLTIAGATGTAAGAYFVQFSYDKTGTGNFQPIIRLQSSGTQAGYNADPLPNGDDAKQFQEAEKYGHNWNRSITSDILHAVTLEDGKQYFQFALDINEAAGGSQPLLSLNELQIYISDTPYNRVTGYYTDDAPGTLVPGLPSDPQSFHQLAWRDSATLVYDLDADDDVTIELNYALATGSGTGDMFAYIPVWYDPSRPYVYLFSAFGVPNASGSGFEEWAFRVGTGYVPPETPIIPLPMTVWAGLALFGLIGVGKTVRRRRELAE